MKARILMDTWERKIEKQIESFYQKHNYAKTDKIKFEIVDDIYKRRLELLKNSQKEIAVTNENEWFLRNVNGHVVWGYTPDDFITVLFSRDKLSQDAHTWYGTVHHEYTHAHDYLEIISALGFDKNEKIYGYEYYREFDFWTEFHARALGSMNVFSNIYKKEVETKNSFYCNDLYEQNCENLVKATSEQRFYDIAQYLGKQLTLEKLFDPITPSLQSACEKYGVLEEIVCLYNYLSSHITLNEVDFCELRNILMCI